MTRSRERLKSQNILGDRMRGINTLSSRSDDSKFSTNGLQVRIKAGCALLTRRRFQG
jgi:hypothetical protein